ncbi:MAG: ABC transporter substrate-binding protein [Deltaproteobacteria bacterium]|nr:ABC transporter substrate-binding protein [Deltaproteobacteria bacterium]
MMKVARLSAVVVFLILIPQLLPAQLKSVKAAYPSVGGGQAPIWVAKEAGAFNRQGLDLDAILIFGGNKIAQAMIAGELQIVQASQAPLISATLGGADLVFIANLYPTMVYSLYVVPEIQKPADLKGKKLGVTSYGAVIDFGTRMILKRFGLAPETDVAIIQIGGQNNAVAAMAARGIHGALLNPPASMEALNLGMRELFDMRDLGVDYAFLGVAVSRAYWNRNPEVVERFMKAYLEGVSIAKKDSAFALRVLEKYTKVRDTKVLTETYRIFVQNALLEKPYTTSQGIQANLDGLAPRLPAAKNAKPETFYDNRIIEKLDRSGYIQSLYQKK